MTKNISLIVTILNEDATIVQLLESIAHQTQQPQEMIIVDGGSIDQSLDVIKEWATSKRTFDLKVLTKKGNRSVGRNYAIENAKHDLIAITDAGCVPRPSWLEKLMDKYEQTQASVIAGYYSANPQTDFEQATVPYVLVMPDKVDSETFLPATRSMMIEKNVWEKVGGFDEKLSDNEDYAFAHKIKDFKFKKAFAKEAIVNWIPRSTLASFAYMIYRFARGDMQAGIVRPKVLFLFARYIFFVLSSLLLLEQGDFLLMLSYWILAGTLYSLWAITKNARYAPKGWYWLPVLQVVADVEVMRGSLVGHFRRYI